MFVGAAGAASPPAPATGAAAVGVSWAAGCCAGVVAATPSAAPSVRHLPDAPPAQSERH